MLGLGNSEVFWLGWARLLTLNENANEGIDSNS